jgi:hypothetical protein
LEHNDKRNEKILREIVRMLEIKKNLIKTIPILKTLLAILILYLIMNKISGYSIDIAKIKKDFNINYFILALLFFIFTQLFGSSILLLLLNLFSKTSLLYVFRIIFTAQFLDYIPFLGIAYKGKKFKDNLKFGYKNFISTYLFLLQIGILNTSFALSLYFLSFPESYFKSNFNIFWIFNLLFIISIFIIFYNKNLVKFLKNFNFIYNSKKKKFILFQLIINYFFFLEKTISTKFVFLKSIILDCFAHIFYFCCFFYIFKCYQIKIEIVDLMFIYLMFSFSTQIKILPKNYGVDEIIGSLLIEISSGSFLLGLVVMLTLRLINLICALILFICFNFSYRLKILRLTFNKLINNYYKR